MSREREWVEAVKAEIEPELARQGISVATGRRLPYAVHVEGYRTTVSRSPIGEPVTKSHGYQTDLLILEQDADKWIPRVVVEFKFTNVSTHDALTYSTKASTHKNLHPYLRYGIVIGGYKGRQVPKRLIRHGEHFDFMAIIASEQLTNDDRDKLVEVLIEEVQASRMMSTLLLEKTDIWLLHRKLDSKRLRE